MTDPCVEAVALKPCPFCGEQLEHVPNEECVSQWFHPLASNCILNGQGIADLTAWNTRIEAITRSEVTEAMREAGQRALERCLVGLVSGVNYGAVVSEVYLAMSSVGRRA